MISVIQLFVLWIANVETFSMLGHSWTSISKPMFVDPSFDDANFATLFATMFWLLEIYINSTLSNSGQMLRQLEVFLHSFLLCFIFLLYLPYYQLRVTLDEQVFSSECFPDSQPHKYSFVLGLIIGGREFQLDSVFKHFSV